MQSLSAFCGPSVGPFTRSRRSRSRSIARRERKGATTAAAFADANDEKAPTSSSVSSASSPSTSTSSSSSATTRGRRSPRVAVIGGGWAGFGAANALCEQGYDVTLLDAARGAGASAAGWRTKTGRAMEAGIKG